MGILYLASLCLLSAVWSEEIRPLEPPLRVDLQPPEEYQRIPNRNVEIGWITMPLDHFDPQNTQTFQMRYMYNGQFFGGPGHPIFIFVGGEWTINQAWLMAGHMFEIASEHEGYMIYTEHRYYGQTMPFTDLTAENLRFLNVDQALADLAYFIANLKESPMFADSKVVLYGCSYAANMAVWFKQRYPHLAVGVAASSGPVLGEVDFVGYLETVHNAFLSEGGEQCIDTMRQGILDAVALMETEEGRRYLESIYRLCIPLDYDNRYDRGYFAATITWTFSRAVQSAIPGSIRTICNNFNTELYGTTPIEKVAGYIVSVYGLQNSCWVIQYENFIATYQQNTESRAWYYQTCTEYGYYQTAPSSGTVFDPLVWLDRDFYINVCKRIFDERFDEEFTYKAVERVNQVFGGLSPDVNNTINIHGTIDPWHVLGIHEGDINESSPTLTAPRASHCFDTRSWSWPDTIIMSQVQQRIRREVASWL